MPNIQSVMGAWGSQDCRPLSQTLSDLRELNLSRQVPGHKATLLMDFTDRSGPPRGGTKQTIVQATFCPWGFTLGNFLLWAKSDRCCFYEQLLHHKSGHCPYLTLPHRHSNNHAACVLLEGNWGTEISVSEYESHRPWVAAPKHKIYL